MNDHRPYADEGEVKTTFNEFRNTLARIEATVAEVKVQTMKTNGRVNGLEQFRAQTKAVAALVVLQLGWLIALGLGFFK